MNRSITFFLISLCIAGTVTAQIPNKFSYQGLLTTFAGTPVADSLYNLKVDIYNAPSGGVLRFSETFTGVSVTRGTFAVLVGSTNIIPPIFSESLYVEVVALAGPAGYPYPLTFSPRTVLVSSPYALSLRAPATLIDSSGSNVLTVINNSNGRGIFSQSRNFTAVKAISTNAFGLAGIGHTSVSGVYGSTIDGLLYFANSGVNGYSHLGYGSAGISDSGIGLIGWANTNRAWGGYVVGKFGVDGRYTPSGDTLVVLPDNSIAAHEILDEPGISQGTSIGYTLTGVSTLVPMDSTTITIPADGYVVLYASALASLYGTTGLNWMAFQLTDAPLTTFDGNNYSLVGPVGSTSTGFTNYMPIAIQRTYFKPKGTHTFYIEGMDASGLGDKYFWNIVLTAMYFPASYGSVNANVPGAQANDFSSAASLGKSTLGGIHSANAVPAYKVDLRELEIRAAKARAEAERADRLLIEGRLKNELAKGKPEDH